MRLPLLLLAALALAACDSSESSVQADSRVIVAYEGSLADGTVFDSSTRSRPFEVAGLIRGFREGIIGMVEGETRRFEVAPEDGYGATGIVNSATGEVIIPPNARLTFEVTLLEIL